MLSRVFAAQDFANDFELFTVKTTGLKNILFAFFGRLLCGTFDESRPCMWRIASSCNFCLNVSLFLPFTLLILLYFLMRD